MAPEPKFREIPRQGFTTGSYYTCMADTTSCDKLSDEDLAAAWAGGNRNACAKLVARYLPTVRTLCRSLLPPEDSEDAAQEREHPQLAQDRFPETGRLVTCDDHRVARPMEALQRRHRPRQRLQG